MNTAFQKFKHRKPNTDEKLILHELKDTYKLSEDDPLWGIFFALNYHLDLYKEIPIQLIKAIAYLEEKETSIFEGVRGRTRSICKNEAKIMMRNHEMEMRKVIDDVIKNSKNPRFLNVALVSLTALASLSIGVIAALVFVVYNPEFLNMF